MNSTLGSSRTQERLLSSSTDVKPNESVQKTNTASPAAENTSSSNDSNDDFTRASGKSEAGRFASARAVTAESSLAENKHALDAVVRELQLPAVLPETNLSPDAVTTIVAQAVERGAEPLLDDPSFWSGISIDVAIICSASERQGDSQCFVDSLQFNCAELANLATKTALVDAANLVTKCARLFPFQLDDDLPGKALFHVRSERHHDEPSCKLVHRIVRHNNRWPGFFELRADRGVEIDPVNVPSSWCHSGQPSPSTAFQSLARSWRQGSVAASR
jgi:hypothetical protein